MKLLLYKASGSVADKLVRWWKKSPYSHCELLIDGVCYSSSVRDGGVRGKLIPIDPDKWDSIALPWADKDVALRHFAATDGDVYSWSGIVWGQFFGREYDEKRAAFCSEWCAAALGLPTPVIYSPEALGRLCKYLGKM